ncbi:MAG: LytTR family transcriptional regulator [Oscillospiraceae bacterium]|nr:LytTR family transcriptional regulator [Oscillospiraceae bacterium]
MKFKLVIDKAKDEEVVATVHSRSALTDRIEELIRGHTGADAIAAFSDDEMRMLPFSQIECITVLNGKTWAIDTQNRRCRLKYRLYELEALLPASFIRINKSTLANEARLERFTVAYSGAVDAVFKCGYREYVSRRCFAQIRRRFDSK